MTEPHPVKLFIGMLTNEPPLFLELTEKLQDMFGPSDMHSDVWKWQHSRYYEKEMGPGLKRRFVFFKDLIMPERITDIKLKTGELEKQYLNGQGGRRINLDPGYIDASKVVLASTKDFSHRMYLAKGIYGEVTLSYSCNGYIMYPYTFPDFRRKDYHDMFQDARNRYKEEIVALKHRTGRGIL